MSEQTKQHILSLSYGKDSLACLGAIEKLGLPLDRIITAEVWATDTIPADLPPMMDFKKKADAIIKERWGIEVEHICAMAKDGTKQTYEKLFYRVPKRRYVKKFPQGTTLGFPLSAKAWCNSELKVRALDSIADNNRRGQNPDSLREQSTDLPTSESLTAQGAKINTVRYLGIAADEPERIARHTKEGFILPLVEIGWDEAYCRQWCEENDLLSPIYATTTRGGCWFCHNQSVDQLRLLRKNYPELWELLLKWDSDSPVTFKADGHTVHDFDRRFQMEDENLIFPYDNFRWEMLDQELNYRWF